MATLVLRLTTADSDLDVRKLGAFGAKQSLPGFLAKLGEMGQEHCSVQLLANDAAASSATLTMDHTKQTAGDILQIGAMSLIAGTDFAIGASNTASASNLAAAINANAGSMFSAAAALAVVTVTASSAGAYGDAIAITLTQADTGITASGATLSGGSDGSSLAIDYKSF